MTGPVILPASTGYTDTYTLQFEDTFSDDGVGAGPYWAYDTLDDALNRTGNEGQDADGVLGSGSVNGKRWSAWANGNNDSFVYRNGGLLYIGGQVLDEPDPTRINYSFGGVNYNWANIRPEVPYMVQWGRVYDDVVGAQVHDLTKPDIYFGPNHFVEIRISVEEMKIPGFRVSLWLTPIIPNESLSYDSSAANGVEIDILEIEKWIDGGYANGRVQSKVLGGDAGSTVPQSGGNVDLLNDHDIDITTGFHTFGLRWDNDGLYWLCDGYEYILDTDHVPQTNHYLSLTRELNSGVYDGADSTQIPSNGVKVPQDIGLFGVSSYAHLDHMPDDKAIVDYIRVWSIDGRTSYFNNPNVDGDSTTVTDTSDAKLVIQTQPAYTKYGPKQHIVAIPKNGYDTTGKTFTWSSDVADLEFIPQGSLVTSLSISNLTADQLATITVSDGE